MKKTWEIKDPYASTDLLIKGSSIKEAIVNENINVILSFFVEDCDSLSVTEWGLSYCDKRNMVLLKVLYVSIKGDQKMELHIEAEPKDIFGIDT
ncbi:hypothetical protein [Paenibacillus sp. UNC217MF]|uniref:hypothetical protein n=1 Tax=Paenibacillus sp. UNC217MF TaxID=1449062 RepID=UPI00048C0419|nr:hypothetical protein [Paenibacillus sp. UNC217MF]